MKLTEHAVAKLSVLANQQPQASEDGRNRMKSQHLMLVPRLKRQMKPTVQSIFDDIDEICVREAKLQKTPEYRSLEPDISYVVAVDVSQSTFSM